MPENEALENTHDHLNRWNRRISHWRQPTPDSLRRPNIADFMETDARSISEINHGQKYWLFLDSLYLTIP